MSHLQNCSLKIYLKRALGAGGWVWGGGGQDGCERRIRRINFFVKIQKTFFFGGGGPGGGGGRVGWDQGGCERRIELKFL